MIERFAEEEEGAAEEGETLLDVLRCGDDTEGCAGNDRDVLGSKRPPTKKQRTETQTWGIALLRCLYCCCAQARVMHK